jgi:hypothetical protein
MKHGPVALVDRATPSVFLMPQGHVYDKVMSNVEEIKARGGPVIAVVGGSDTEVGRLPRAGERGSPARVAGRRVFGVGGAAMLSLPPPVRVFFATQSTDNHDDREFWNRLRLKGRIGGSVGLCCHPQHATGPQAKYNKGNHDRYDWFVHVTWQAGQEPLAPQMPLSHCSITRAKLPVLSGDFAGDAGYGAT